MTARCALVWVPWKYSRVPDYAHGYFSQNFKWTFVSIEPMNVHTESWATAKMTARCAVYMGALKMLKIFESPWKSESPSTAIFVEIFNGLLFRSILWVYVQKWKFVAIHVPGTIKDTKKIGHPRSLFSKILNGLLFAWTLWMYWPNFEVRI